MSRFESRNARYASADINERGGGEEENGTFVPFVPRKTRNRKRTYRIENGLDSVSYLSLSLSLFLSPHGPPRAAIREEIDRFYIYIYIFSSHPFFFLLSRFDFTTDIATSVTRDNPPLSLLLLLFPFVSPRFVKHLFGTIKTRRPRWKRRGKDNVDVRHTYISKRIANFIYAHPPHPPPPPYPYSVDLNRLDEILLYTTSNKIRKGKLNRGFLRSKLRDVLASSRTNQRTNERTNELSRAKERARFFVSLLLFFLFFSFLFARGSSFWRRWKILEPGDKTIDPEYLELLSYLASLSFLSFSPRKNEPLLRYANDAYDFPHNYSRPTEE